MAIAVDATSVSGFPASHPITISHTVGAGANRLLVVGISQSAALPPSINAVTYGGVALTQAALNNSNNLAAIYYLVNPTSGTANIVVTLSATGGGFAAFGISFTGVDQTTPIDVTNTTSQAFGTGNTLNESITTIAANAYLVDVGASEFTGTAGTLTPGAGQTAVLNAVSAGGFDAALGGYKSVGAAGAQTLSWSHSNTGNSQFYAAVVSVQPIIAGAAPPKRLLLLGVG